jgi:tRNA (cmo5U34)-methyltransferase
MPQQSPSVAFDEQHAAEYDTRFAKAVAMTDALHLLTAAVLGGLPTDARVLSVGAGTGAEIVSLARRFPGWRFTAVEPSGPMLAVFRRKAEEGGIASRCEFHEGFLDSLPASESFDAATSFLVSQFVLDTTARTAFFRAIADRLRPGGALVAADLAADITTEEYRSLFEVWLRVLDVPPEKADGMRTAYGRDVALLPAERVGEIIRAGGFEPPVRFLQTGLIHAWYAQRSRTIQTGHRG